jgi:aminoglycoside phosphotransferase (APT) family kinase protein
LNSDFVNLCVLWEEFGQNLGNLKQDAGRSDLARIRRGRGAEMGEFAVMQATVFVSEECDVDFETMFEWWTGRFTQ